MGKLFRAEIDSALLSEIVSALAEACIFYSTQACGAHSGTADKEAISADDNIGTGAGADTSEVPPDVEAAHILAALARGTRFALCASFLSVKDRALVGIIASLFAKRFGHAASADGGAPALVDGISTIAGAAHLREVHASLIAAYGVGGVMP